MSIEPIAASVSNMVTVGKGEIPVEKGALNSDQEAPKDIKGPDLSKLVSDAQRNIDVMHGKNLNFSVHEASGRTMISVTDETTGQIVREIPSREMLNLAVKLEEMMGLIFDEKF
jgi:flagellar protein FlaG